MSPAPNEVLPGPTARRVIENVTALRQTRGYTRERLSARLADVGRPIRATGLARLEAGRRRVDADDLVALALALGVSPVRLLLPAQDEGDDVRITDERAAPWPAAWAWATGEWPLSGQEPDAFLAESQPHHSRAPSREVLRWDDQLDVLRAALRRTTDELGVPPAVVRAYVDAWTTVRPALQRGMPEVDRLRREREVTD